MGLLYNQAACFLISLYIFNVISNIIPSFDLATFSGQVATVLTGARSPNKYGSRCNH